MQPILSRGRERIGEPVDLPCMARCRAARTLRPEGVRLRSVSLDSPPCAQRLQVAEDLSPCPISIAGAAFPGLSARCSFPRQLLLYSIADAFQLRFQ